MLTPATLTAETDAALLIADELEKSNVIFVTLRQVQEQNRALREQVQTAQSGQDGETWCMLKWLDKEYPEFEPVYMGFALE